MRYLLATLLFISSSAFALTNTTYIPQGYPLDASKVQGAGQGVANLNCAANTTTNIDLTLTDDMIITGMQVITVGSSLGDYVELKVLAGGVTVATPIPGPWYLASNNSEVFELAFPMKVVSGLTLRFVVHATLPLVTPAVMVNFKLWKVLQ